MILLGLPYLALLLCHETFAVYGLSNKATLHFLLDCNRHIHQFEDIPKTSRENF